MRLHIVLLALAGAALAGCVASPSPTQGLEPEAAPAAASPQVLTWEGHMRLGAALELPAHLAETSGAVRPVWSVGFRVDASEAPQAMEVTLSWTSPLARIKLMVVEPQEEDPVVIYESASTDASPICFAIPPEALRAGVWNVMAHSDVAVDAALAFEVALTGGKAEVVDEPSHVTAAEFPGVLTSGRDGEPQDCAPA